MPTVSVTIDATVDAPILKLKASAWNEDPVARYLKKTKQKKHTYSIKNELQSHIKVNSFISISDTGLRKKWKYLREKFGTEYSKRPLSRSGDAAGNFPASKWAYYQQLMFLKDIVQWRPSSGSIAPSMRAPIVPPADTAAAEDVNIDDAASQCSHDSPLTNVANQLEEEMGSSQAAQENETVDNLEISQGAGPSFPTVVSSKRKRKSQEEGYYQRMCNIEERKLQYLVDKHDQKKTDAEDEDLMFLKTLLPHIRKISPHMKLRFQSRIQDVVQEFAYGPQNNQSDTAVYQSYSYSTTPSPVDPLYTSTYSSSPSPSTSFDYAQMQMPPRKF